MLSSQIRMLIAGHKNGVDRLQQLLKYGESIFLILRVICNKLVQPLCVGLGEQNGSIFLKVVVGNVQDVVRVEEVRRLGQHFDIKFQCLIYSVLIDDGLVENFGVVLLVVLHYAVDGVDLHIFYWFLVEFDTTFNHSALSNL